MRAFFLGCVFLLLAGGGAADAALQFPPLTGHVVDDAHILSPQSVDVLERTLADYENGTGNQVVVATLPSLQGTSIEDYGYQLGRYWGIGQKGKDNGVLLIIAPHEHKVRIEVGYGLEGTLTDAASSEIIHTIILPAFHAGHMEQGTIEGTQAILTILGGHSLPSRVSPAAMNGPDAMGPVTAWLILFVFLWIFIWRVTGSGLAATYLASNALRMSGSRVDSSGWGGGFSGGGGSFGGGGASGGW